MEGGFFLSVSSPVMKDGAIYFGNTDGNIQALR